MAKFKCDVCGQTFEADTMPDKCPICMADSSHLTEVVEAGAQAEAAPGKKGLNTNSDVYTVVYAAVMVIIVAFLLAFVASSLKETQEANVANDTKGQILTALGYDKAALDVAATYAEKVKDNLFVDGGLNAYDGKFNTSYGTLIKEGELHVFSATTANGENAYVIPVVGRGLWGGLWGYIAIDEAKTKVLGTYFYHESETAGLGARIGESWFQEQFIGKSLWQNGDTLTVVKAGSAIKDDPCQVDGVTGATLTSDGVAAMVKDGLKAYKAFLDGTDTEVSDCESEAESDAAPACTDVCDQDNVES